MPIFSVSGGFINPKINNSRNNIIQVLRNIGIIKSYYGGILYNYGCYDWVRFDLEKLKEYDKKGVEKYINMAKENYYSILKYDNNIDNLKEYKKNNLPKKTNNELKKEIKPFTFSKMDGEEYSITLYQDDYIYDWLNETKGTGYGDGHCYNDLFRDYLIGKLGFDNEKLLYDSENGMFCVYCDGKRLAEKVAYELSNLYKNEEKMIELIKKTKEKYNYVFRSIDI